MQASQVERDAGLALLNKPNDVKTTLHYDTTSRCHIDGEWPSIILNFSDGRDFELRPIFFAYEDREQIVLLLVETIKRLAVAATGSDLPAIKLWEKVYAIMTDSVSKNLKIEDGISESFGSTHKPLHLLCKPHTVEKLDACNLAVLAKFENMVKQRDVLESINPRLKSFFRGKKTTVEAGIEALLKLVAHKHSGNTTSHADTFDHICEREGVVKRLFLYQQRRFTKLGKSAASLLEAYPILKMLVDEVTESNQLVEACRIYMASEIFRTELEVLAYFTHHVTFPFLHCIEKSTQQELLVTLPKLHTDLQNGKMDTLSTFVVEMRHVPVEKPTTELGSKLLNLMCLEAAEGVMLQCGAEYGFAQESSKRATDLSLLTEEELEGLATGNLKCERHLSVFDNRSEKVAKCRNQKFTAKSIRNDVMLYRKVQTVVDPATKLITKLLDERESIWTENQKKVMQERIKLKLQKAVNLNVMLKKLLIDCKVWGGPTTSTAEILEALRKNPDKQKFILRTELAYFVHTHKTEKTQRPDLFRQNLITDEEKLENFCILLSDDAESCTATIANLPTNEDGINALSSDSSALATTSKYQVNEMRVVFWVEGNDFAWYVGYITEVDEDEDSYVIDHLHRNPNKQNKFWYYPPKPDKQTVLCDQIVDIEAKGEWTMEARNRRFLLTNEKEILYKFNETIKDH